MGQKVWKPAKVFRFTWQWQKMRETSIGSLSPVKCHVLWAKGQTPQSLSIAGKTMIMSEIDSWCFQWSHYFCVFPFGCVWSSCKDGKRLAHACRCDTPNSCQVEQAVSCSCNVIMYYIMFESSKHTLFLHAWHNFMTFGCGCKCFSLCWMTFVAFGY